MMLKRKDPSFQKKWNSNQNKLFEDRNHVCLTTVLSPEPRCLLHKEGNQYLTKLMVNTGKYTCCLNSKSSHLKILEQTMSQISFRYFGRGGGMGVVLVFKQTKVIKESKEPKKICLGRKGSRQVRMSSKVSS